MLSYSYYCQLELLSAVTESFNQGLLLVISTMNKYSFPSKLSDLWEYFTDKLIHIIPKKIKMYFL